MRISVKASLFLFLGLILPVNTSHSTPPEDMETSGSDAEDSGDWADDDDMEDMDVPSNSTDVRIDASNAGGGPSRGSPVLTFDNTYWPAEDTEPGDVVVANSKSFLERQELLAGVIAGGVIGVILAAALAGILIYKWQKKDDGGYSQGQQSASDEDYHNAKRDEVHF